MTTAFDRWLCWALGGVALCGAGACLFAYVQIARAIVGALAAGSP